MRQKDRRQYSNRGHSTNEEETDRQQSQNRMDKL